MNQLKEDIDKQQFKNVYLLYGEERYLKNQYRDKLRDGTHVSSMNISSYSGKDINYNEVIDLAETMPFMDDYRVILLEDTGCAKNSCDVLADYIQSVPETTIIIITESEVDKRSRVYKEVVKYGRATEFSRMSEDTLTTWILSKVKAEHKQITAGAIKSLYERCGDDMECINSELEKLFSYTLERDAITAEDVDDICVKQVEADIFEMINNVAGGNRQAALATYYELLNRKEPPLRILFLLTRQFNQLLLVRLLAEDGLGRKEIAFKMGWSKDFIAKKNLDVSRRFSVEQLKEAVKECVEAETCVKTGRLNDIMSVELILIKYSSKKIESKL